MPPRKRRKTALAVVIFTMWFVIDIIQSTQVTKRQKCTQEEVAACVPTVLLRIVFEYAKVLQLFSFMYSKFCRVDRQAS